MAIWRRWIERGRFEERVRRFGHVDYDIFMAYLGTQERGVCDGRRYSSYLLSRACDLFGTICGSIGLWIRVRNTTYGRSPTRHSR